MEFFKKLLPLIIVAIVFAVGGYFIGRGALNNQTAALYKATGTLNAVKPGGTASPCDYSPTNPCAGAMAKVNITCPEGFMSVNGKCMPTDLYAKASIESAPNYKFLSDADKKLICETWYRGWGYSAVDAKVKCNTLVAAPSSPAKN